MTLSTLITDEAYREHAAFWTAVLGRVDGDFHLRQPWLSYAVAPGARASERITLSGEAAAWLRQVGPDDLGAFAVLMAAVSRALHVHTGATPVVVDTPPLAGQEEGTDRAIPLVLDVDVDRTVRDHLAQTADRVAASYSFQPFPIAEASVALVGRARPRTNVLAWFDGVHAAPAAEASAYDVRIRMARSAGNTVTIDIEGRGPVVGADYVRLFARHFANIAGGLRDLQQPLGAIDVLGADERGRVVDDYSRGDGVAAPASTIAGLFEQQARRTPDRDAVRGADRTLSYDALNRAANRLARFLQAEYGIGKGDVVGVVSHRSDLLVAGILGTLKAGAVYLPIDPEYPEERLRFMLADAGVKALLVHSDHMTELAPFYETPMFALDIQLDALETGDEDLTAQAGPGDLAYIIYTSGSTGQPKAVLLEHGGFVNMAAHHIDAFGIGPEDRLLQFYGHSFDSSLFEIFVSLLSGAAVVMVDRETINDPERLSAHIAAHGVTTLTLPPVYQSTLDRGSLGSVRRYVSAGDHCRLDDALTLARTSAYYNSYGPTETSVCVTHYQIDPDRSYGSRVPIGKPISNTTIFLLDDRLAPVPEGVVGEICVGGVSLARQYLNRDDVTAEKFVASPFAPGERLYRTGDLGVWLPDGNLELIGRKDHQVKVRGYRVELGEIDAVLTQHPGVSEAATLAIEDDTGHKRLVAFVTGAGLNADDLRAHLQARLPDFMIPSSFVVLDAMPTTANGKIDRKALPALAAATAPAAQADDGPRNPAEEALVAIWQEVLGRGHVGIHENLFEIGGDSILVIQIVSRARQAGLKITPAQMFEHQTVAALAAVATPVAAGPAQDEDEGPLAGPAPLGPMQEWFFARHQADPHHFNQSVAFTIHADVDPVAAEGALAALIEHHDALRLRFAAGAGGGWTAEYGPAGGTTPFTIVDLSAVAAADRAAIREEALADVQRSFNLATGPLIRVALVHTGAGAPPELLFVVHHLAVDGVSWRVLLEDFRTAYGQIRRGQSPALPPKTASYRAWAAGLRAQAALVDDERGYWLDPARRDVAPIPVDRAAAPGANTVGSTVDVVREIDAAATSAMLHEAPRAYATDVNDLLLSALALTVAGWTGGRRLLVDVEGHGREEILDDLDTSRTVGWFTSQFPVLLDVDPAAPLGDTIKSVKEQLRAVPRRGAGYGVLRYLSGDAALAADLAALPQAEVLFNYLGQSGGSADADLPWTPRAGGTGPEISARAGRSHLIEINAIVVDGRLKVVWTYSSAAHTRETIDRLASRYEETLGALVDHCRSVQGTQHTPSDFPAARLDQKSLDALLARISGS